MSAENGQKEKKPFKIKEFFKSTSFKCIAVLLAIVLVCGILLTICNSLFEVTDQERLDRVLSQIYGESVETKEHKLTEYETTEFDNGSINNVYEVTSDGNYLISSTGTGGFSGGTVTCWVVIEMTDGSVSGIGNVVVSENTNQSWIANVPDSAFEHFGESYTDGETFDVSDWQDNGLTGGATGSTTAIVNAVNTALLFARSQIAGEVIEPSPLEGFSYTEYINGEATTFELAEDGTSVIFHVTTTNIVTHASTIDITVNSEDVITAYTVTSDGTTDGSWKEDTIPDILSGERFLNKKASDLISLLGTADEDGGFAPETSDDTLHTGATYTNFYYVYAAVFAASNYENAYIAALESSLQYTQYIDMDNTTVEMSGTDVVYHVTTTNIVTHASTIDITVNSEGVITAYTVTSDGTTDGSWKEDTLPDILNGERFLNKKASDLISLLGSADEDGGFTPETSDETLHTGATYTNFYYVYAAVFAASNYQTYAKLIEVLPPVFDYTEYIDVENTTWTVADDGASVTFHVTTTNIVTHPSTIDITVNSEGVITAYTVTSDGTTDGSWKEDTLPDILNGERFLNKKASDLISLLGSADEDGSFTPETSDSSLHTGATYTNFYYVYAAVFAAENYDLLITAGGAEV